MCTHIELKRWSLYTRLTTSTPYSGRKQKKLNGQRLNVHALCDSIIRLEE